MWPGTDGVLAKGVGVGAVQFDRFIWSLCGGEEEGETSKQKGGRGDDTRGCRWMRYDICYGHHI